LHPGAVKVDLDTEDGPTRYNVEAYTFETDKYFGAKRNGKHVVPLGDRGDNILVNIMVKLLGEEVEPMCKSMRKKAAQKHVV
jgi:hypothetical protein